MISFLQDLCAASAMMKQSADAPPTSTLTDLERISHELNALTPLKPSVQQCKALVSEFDTPTMPELTGTYTFDARQIPARLDLEDKENQVPAASSRSVSAKLDLAVTSQ